GAPSATIWTQLRPLATITSVTGDAAATGAPGVTAAEDDWVCGCLEAGRLGNASWPAGVRGPGARTIPARLAPTNSTPATTAAMSQFGFGGRLASFSCSFSFTIDEGSECS